MAKVQLKDFKDAEKQLTGQEYVYISQEDNTRKTTLNGISEFTNKKLDEKFNDINTNINQLSNPNLLINGDFQVWQRGTSFNISTSSRGYTADRWRVFNQANTTSIITKTTDGIKHTSTGTGVSSLEYVFEVPTNLKNKTVTFSYEMKCSKPIVIDFYIFKGQDIVQVLTTKKISCTTDYNIFTHTFVIPSDVDLVTFWINRVGEGRTEGITFDVKWVKLELGTVATPFTPRPFGEELALCQRY